MSSSNQQLTGTFEIDGKRGFLRDARRNYGVHPKDVAVEPDLVRRYNLRGGETICGHTSGGSERRGRSSPKLIGIDSINELPPENYAELAGLADLTPIDPREPVRFETPGGPATMRILDLLTPIGRGQRGLIVAPPRTGKTVLLEQMAAGVAANHPDVYVMVLLIDERPEEVTSMRRAVPGEVIASSNDRDLASHIRLARLGIEKAKRMVECGAHVLILLDSLTRLGRAFNAYAGNSGRIMSGGLDSRALIEPKSIFGAARNIEHGGSLTIMATALIETGSRMDEVIFNEFKGTGNMEIVLSRELANKRIWPAIDLEASGTRKEELLLDADTLKVSHEIRRNAIGRPPDRAMEALLDQIAQHPDNRAFVAAAAK
ncbi:MAG: transcription termination factor Rho [bacterium]|nr:transcription termination factor Rho [bacterium]